jgi:hypothetical protein
MNTKKIFLGLLVFGSTITGFSQGKVTFGVKGGLNVSSLTGDYPSTEKTDSKIGFHVGGTLELELTSKFSLLGEALISTQGNKKEVVTSVSKTTQNISLTYLNIPVLVKYNILPKLSLEFGPQIGFAVSGKDKYEISDSEIGSFSLETDLLKDGSVSILGTPFEYKKYLNTVDFSLNLGASFQVTEKFYVQARYNKGLTNLDVKNVDLTRNYSGKDLKNSVLQLSLGYKF